MTEPSTTEIREAYESGCHSEGHDSWVGILLNRLEEAENGWKEAVNRHGKTLQRAYKAEATIKVMKLFVTEYIDSAAIYEEWEALCGGTGYWIDKVKEAGHD